MVVKMDLVVVHLEDGVAVGMDLMVGDWEV